MNNHRRNVLKSGSGAALLSVLAAAGIIRPGMAFADWNKAAFEAKSMADTLKAMGAGSPAESKDAMANVHPGTGAASPASSLNETLVASHPV